MAQTIPADKTLSTFVSEASETASVSSWQSESVVSSNNDNQHPAPSTSAKSLTSSVQSQSSTHLSTPVRRRRKKATSEILDENDEPVVDQTAALPLHSKRTERLQRKQQKKSEKLAYQQSLAVTLLSLPNEILPEICRHLQPTDIVSLLLTNRALHSVIGHQEAAIARAIIRQRYWVLQQCFTLPVPISDVPEHFRPALTSPVRGTVGNMYRASYQHLPPLDSDNMCTCHTCTITWQNLSLIIDLHHWQPYLENREPLPTIPRGTNPEWNTSLLRRNADLVRTATARPLVYAYILQMHLDTITQTIQRASRWRRKLGTAVHPHTPTPPQPQLPPELQPTTRIPSCTHSMPQIHIPIPTKSVPYHQLLSPSDLASGTDAYLDRHGPPSYEFPWTRDNYYSMEAYVPNRRWNDEEGRWMYYSAPLDQHNRDLNMLKGWADKWDEQQRKNGGAFY